MIDTAARAAAVVGLQTSDVDLDRIVAVIRRGKGGKGRVVPIGDATPAALDRYLRVRRYVGALRVVHGHRSSVGYGQAPEPGGLVA